MSIVPCTQLVACTRVSPQCFSRKGGRIALFSYFEKKKLNSGQRSSVIAEMKEQWIAFMHWFMSTLIRKKHFAIPLKQNCLDVSLQASNSGRFCRELDKEHHRFTRGSVASPSITHTNGRLASTQPWAGTYHLYFVRRPKSPFVPPCGPNHIYQTLSISKFTFISPVWIPKSNTATRREQLQ